MAFIISYIQDRHKFFAKRGKWNIWKCAEFEWQFDPEVGRFLLRVDFTNAVVRHQSRYSMATQVIIAITQPTLVDISLVNGSRIFAI